MQRKKKPVKIFTFYPQNDKTNPVKIPAPKLRRLYKEWLQTQDLYMLQELNKLGNAIERWWMFKAEAKGLNSSLNREDWDKAFRLLETIRKEHIKSMQDGTDQ